MSDIQLRVKDLRKTFHPGLFEADVEVLKGLTFEVERGEIFGFLGPNGAGKTTTIKAITELIFPDSGEIEVCGFAHDSPQAKRRIGFMSESPYVYRHLTGREYLNFCGEILGLPRDRVAARIFEVLDNVGMAQRADRTMGNYSKGMQQRIALAQALLGEPELLILDEPMSGLDPVGRRDVREIIVEQAKSGTTIFFSSHIIPDVEALCDRVAIVVDGTVRAIGSVRDLVERKAESFEATFSGATPEELDTPLLASHRGSDASWAKVATEHRDELIRELNGKGALLVSLNPVRISLEDLLMKHYEGGAS